MTINLKNLTIPKAHTAMMNGDYSAVDLARAYLSEIEKKNKELNVYLEVYADVLDQAKEADARIKAGTATILTGIPIAVKDCILLKGRRAGSSSKILEGYVAPYDATAISKLKSAGVVFLGRTNMDEFAMGSSTETSAYGVTKNPYDQTRVPGGSSGGSAAAVASDMALAALGSDTAGSVRQPASFCGVVGMKPTYGGISRHGLMAMCSSLDQIGPITKTAEDAEILWNAMKGIDPYDSTSLDISIYGRDKIKKEKLIIGVPSDFTEMKGMDQCVSKNFSESIEKLKKLGHTIKNIKLPSISYSLAVYYIIMPAILSTNLARFDGVKYGTHKDGENLLEDYLMTRGNGFGREARRRILLGTYVLSSGYYDAYYNKANAVKDLIQKEFDEMFASGIDIVATPTAPSPAFKIGEKVSDPLQMYLADIFTVPANIVGIPAISLPSGFVEEKNGDQKSLPIKLPLAIQFMAPAGAEAMLFDLAKSM